MKKAKRIGLGDEDSNGEPSCICRVHDILMSSDTNLSPNAVAPEIVRQSLTGGFLAMEIEPIESKDESLCKGIHVDSIDGPSGTAFRLFEHNDRWTVEWSVNTEIHVVIHRH